MERLSPNIDPYANDPGHWGASLITLAEIVVPLLDATGAKSVVEVGAYAGDLTGLLVEWAGGSGARVWAIDPSPRRPLVELAEQHPELELVRQTSHAALAEIPLPDAAIIDGDHNYFTVSEELRLIAERAGGAELPVLIFHDVAWPHGRRDDYYDPALVPEDARRPIHEGAGVFPGEPGIRPGGLPYRYAAAHEGGPRNGVLTAVEDFVAEREGLRLAVVPAFFGLGVVWPERAPYADAVAELLEFWDRNPLLERLEANRVLHLASSHFQMVQAARAGARAARQEAVLRRLLDSSAFGIAERLSRLRQRVGIATWASVVSKDDIRRALEDE
jgi:methyltransferase family protein